MAAVKLKKADLPPKKPAPAYSLFVAEHFQTLDKGVNHKDAFVARNKELAERWKQMSDAEKRVCAYLPVLALLFRTVLELWADLVYSRTTTSTRRC